METEKPALTPYAEKKRRRFVREEYQERQSQYVALGHLAEYIYYVSDSKTRQEIRQLVQMNRLDEKRIFAIFDQIDQPGFIL
jgi:outer membrane protein assembly factor BamD (BamD/ComL family)